MNLTEGDGSLMSLYLPCPPALSSVFSLCLGGGLPSAEECRKDGKPSGGKLGLGIARRDKHLPAKPERIYEPSGGRPRDMRRSEVSSKKSQEGMPDSGPRPDQA
jgi:hypothetical protein